MADVGTTYREGILREALQYITKDRNAAHGEPEDNLLNIIRFVDAYVQARFGVELPWHSYDAAMLAIMIKLGRAAVNPYHRDNFVDLAGYAALAAEVVEQGEPVEDFNPINLAGDSLRALIGDFDEPDEPDEPQATSITLTDAEGRPIQFEPFPPAMKAVRESGVYDPISHLLRFFDTAGRDDD